MMEHLKEEEATIFNIQKFSVHDGPGIRTTVFFKGCPLRCLWCFSPEGLKPYPQVAVYKRDCIGIDMCGKCLRACPHAKEQILQVENGIVTGIDREKCRNCLACAEACPNSSLKVFGKRYTVRQLMQAIMEDRAFYRESGGGVTCTGGDPMIQYKFIREFLKECKRYGIHTCLESEFQCKREAVEAVMPYVDLWITDIKAMSSAKHQQFTGMENGTILSNIKFIVENGAKLIMRTPVVPGYNDDEENIRATAQFVSEELRNQIVQYQLLAYRTLGMDKYEALGLPYPLADLEMPEDEEYLASLRSLAKLMTSYGVPAVVGSYTKYKY